jgi:chemotaxis receptor (MCP) glutamine deamidase CheD
MREIYLKPGDCVAVTRPTILRTILGSCVSIVLIDPEARVAGLNHYLLPEAPAGAAAGDTGRYGDLAIPLLLRKVMHSGASQERLVARIFGGGAVVGALMDEFAVGELNIEIARRLLAVHQIEVLSEDVGGYEGLHLTFDTSDFSVAIREIVRHG